MQRQCMFVHGNNAKPTRLESKVDFCEADSEPRAALPGKHSSAERLREVSGSRTNSRKREFAGRLYSGVEYTSIHEKENNCFYTLAQAQYRPLNSASGDLQSKLSLHIKPCHRRGAYAPAPPSKQLSLLSSSASPIISQNLPSQLRTKNLQTDLLSPLESPLENRCPQKQIPPPGVPAHLSPRPREARLCGLRCREFFPRCGSLE